MSERKYIKCRWEDGYERTFGPYLQKDIDKYTEEEILGGLGLVVGDQVIRPISLEFEEV
jgi:hypothetical protein